MRRADHGQRSGHKEDGHVGRAGQGDGHGKLERTTPLARATSWASS